MSRPSILITGCSQGGIGDALARRFAARGYHVYATLRNPDKAAELANVPNVELLALDVTSSESIQRAAADVKRREPSGKLDILVNNAGMGVTGPLIEVDLEVARKVYDVNVFGLLAVTQAFATMLIAAKGKVVNVSSVGGILRMAYGGIYHSSKSAVTMLSETLRMELAPLGVTVITGMLGHIESKFHDNDVWEGLSESSHYKPVESYVKKVKEGSVGPRVEKLDTFADNFVKDILSGRSGQVYRGAFAQATRFIGYHAPASVVDMAMIPQSGLDKMAKEAKQN